MGRWRKLKAALERAAGAPGGASGLGEGGGPGEAGGELAPWAEAARAAIEACVQETAGWDGERIRRVAARLNRVRVPCSKLEALPIAAEAAIAFTLPGRHIYLPRELLRRLPGDAALAFVLAREMAHHDLGHVRHAARRIGRLPPLPMAVAILGAVRMLQSPELEAASDAQGIKLCLRAGYRREECLEAFRALEILWLETGGADAFLGLEGGDIEEAADRTFEEAPQWRWERKRRHLSLRESRTRLQGREEGGSSVGAPPFVPER